MDTPLGLNLANLFCAEIFRLMRSNPDNPNIDLEWNMTSKFFILEQRLSPPANTEVVHPLVRLDMRTLDVYSPHGTKSRGNLNDSPFHGFDLVDCYGVIVGPHSSRNIRYNKRLKELNQQ